MPTNRKRRARSAQVLDSQHIAQFIDGLPLLAGTGFSEGIGSGGCGTWTEADWLAFEAAAAAGWQQHGAAFLRWWRCESEQFTALFRDDPRKSGAQPWALETFGEPNP